MGIKEKVIHPNPLLKAGFLSKFFFWWLKDIIWYGRTHNLVTEDLYDTLPEDLSDSLTHKLESAWIEEVKDSCQRNKKPSLWKVFTRVYFVDFTKFIIFPIGFATILTSQPLLLSMMMSYFRPDTNVTPQWAYFNATVFVVLMILPTVCLCHGLFRLNRLGMRARIACTSLIYRKMIRLSSSTNRTMGSSIISLLTIDVAKLEFLFSYAPFIAIVPVQLLVVTCLIWKSVGIIAASIGIGLMILQTFPVQVLYSKLTLKFRAKQVTRTDNRVFLIDEIINGMKAIKMYVWETYLEKLVYLARKLEIANYVKISYISSVVWSFTAISHRLCAFAIMLTYVIQHSTITVSIILPVTQHLFNLQSSICIFFFVGVRSITDMHVSMKRIEDFLLLEEVKFSIESIDDNNARGLVSLENVTARWDEKSVIFKNIDLHFSHKNLYAIIGSVGSGKSSLLKLILGELQTVSGKVFRQGKISYASQEPWLFNNTVKENILFGEEYYEDKYLKVVKACALSEDFRQFPYGDETLVGDRGSNLSGGQCARVNLARAVYRDADVYLLDDPLSAVDARVAKNIIIGCINGLLENKTRILVTHSIQQLDRVDEIIVLDHGRVKFRGTTEHFLQIDQYVSRSMIDETEISKKIEKKIQTEELSISDNSMVIKNKKDIDGTDVPVAEGNINKIVYLSYIKSGGWTLAFLVILTNVLFLMAVSTFDFGLAAWTNDENIHNKSEIYNNDTRVIHISPKLNSLRMKTMILTFGGIILSVIFASILRNFLLYKFALKASKNIHNCIFSRMMTATLQFFEGNSAGKVLNRFSEDTGIVDNVLPHALFNTINTTFDVIAFFLPAIIAIWWILIPCSISIFISLLIGKVYVGTIQKIKKLAASARSPILSFAASSMAGVTTIRACKAEKIVFKDFNYRQDCQTAAQFMTVASAPAFALWIELVNLGLLASITYLCVFLKNEDTYEGYVGLSLMQILSITENMSFVANQIAEVFAHMTSVERMLQFTKLEQETLIEYEPGSKLPDSWPENGKIIFDHLCLRYSPDSDPVLWDVNCKVEPGSKIGIVGRTGAGKSSLISTLFRFTKFDGSLFIDGVDTKTVNLHKLRSKVSIIPQVPVLFKSSLRKNLDPFDKYDDATLWSALENVELKNIFNSLEFSIERGGSNLSVGQRQLLCLARAIISKIKILVLDEATANVDSATDALIQATVRSRFKKCTVLTVAHRLNTIMDSDKILVMDNGRITEYDHPFILLQNTQSYFFQMVQQLGNSMMQHLISIAKQTYDNVGTHHETFDTDINKKTS